MKLFPVIAAVVLHAVVAIEHDSNEDPRWGVPFVEIVTINGESLAKSTSGSGSLSFESITDYVAHIVDGIELWSVDNIKTMNDWVKPNSVKYKMFQKKMNETDSLVADMKKLPESEDSVAALESIEKELAKTLNEVNDLVYESVKASLAKKDKGALTMEELLGTTFVTNSNVVKSSNADSTSTEASDEGSIKQTSEDSTTQSSPSFQKTWDKLTGSAPAAKPTK